MEPKQQAELDQAVSASADIIPMALKAIYDQLKQVGFDEQFAQTLTIEYLHATFGKPRA